MRNWTLVEAVVAHNRRSRAEAIAAHGGFEAALAAGALAPRCDLALSEAVVLGLLRQGVTRYACVLGHGSTEIGDVLRVYSDAGVVKAYAVRHETEAAHAAMALRWVTGEKAAVVTSIGPGALQAMAGSLAAASDGVGVWHIYGDETTEDEGPNMQQVPKHDQGLFLQLCATMGSAYSLHTPQAVATALRRGLNRVDHPYRAGPFYLLLPLNTQPVVIPRFNLDELPCGAPAGPGAAGDAAALVRAAAVLDAGDRVVVKVGGGARGCGPELDALLGRVDGVAVTSPLVSGVLTYDHPRNMGVGGSKGSICGNHAMENADTLLVVGSRAVCQSDCSRTGYPNVRWVVNVNTDADDATHYGRTTALVGDAAATLRSLLGVLGPTPERAVPSMWLDQCTAAKAQWAAYKSERIRAATLHDEVWDRRVLTQPAAIDTVTRWARAHDAVTFFDAGDVQANGFQVVEDDRLGRTFTETGASYMGFAASAVLATALSADSFYAVAVVGDGSFTMNPQILIDGVAHGATGCIVVLDNRRMGAISSLQRDQYGTDFATWDHVPVDYVAWASAVEGVAAFHGGYSTAELETALDAAHSSGCLSLVHLPVYFGDDPLGGLGAWGRWNVGSWVPETQALRHDYGL